MKRYFVLFFMLISSAIQLFSQDTDWFMFEDEKTELKGYKDVEGNIKIEPKFSFYTSATIFKDIIPVMEKEKLADGRSKEIKNYYLLKNGRVVGKDSLYIQNQLLDCENEGKIRFRDPITNKVGFFGRDGKVVIPAEYEEAKPFYNNLALTLKDAKKVCWEGTEYDKDNPCEHWNWSGNTVLINTDNEVVLDNLDLIETSYLDMYSLKINQSGLDNTYVNFKTKNGDIYSFIDVYKQFEKWFFNSFITKNKTRNLENLLFNTVTFRQENLLNLGKSESKEDLNILPWGTETKEEFISKNRKALYRILDKINSKSYETIISNDSSPIMFTNEQNKEYFTDCGQYDSIKYPYFTVNITEYKTGKVINYLGFIRTSEGEYRLLEID